MVLPAIKNRNIVINDLTADHVQDHFQTRLVKTRNPFRVASVLALSIGFEPDRISDLAAAGIKLSH